MRKLTLAVLMAVALGACDKAKINTTPEDYKIVKDAVTESEQVSETHSVAINPMIKKGEMGDVFFPVKATEQLKAIYAKNKTAKFWSIKVGEKKHVMN